MLMKVSDFIIKYLEDYGIEDVFLLAGGGIMHLMDSLAKSTKIKKYYNLHEQASGFAADGYAQYKNCLGVCFVTTGPGATNVITPLASSYIDSTPVLYISGQVKTADITKISGVRQTGAQEVGIIPIVKTITKYAVTIKNPREVRYHLEKAIYLAMHGRKGTVWLDIPLDVQNAMLDTDNLPGYFAPDDELNENDLFSEDYKQIIRWMSESRRPCILVGTGVCLSGAVNEFIKLVNEIKVPVVTSRRVKRIFNETNNEFDFGAVGAFATRSGNYVLQNSDFLLIIGCGLRYYITAYNEEGFAPLAKKVIVNIHEPEIKKLRMKIEKALVCDAKGFINGLLNEDLTGINVSNKWLEYCKNIKAKYNIMNEISTSLEQAPNGYTVAHTIYEYSKKGDTFIGSPSAFGYIQYAHSLKEGQQYIIHMGLGSMGTALPCGIGACIASGKRRTVICEGDGSLQHNIQELALISEYQLPIKLFIDSNNGYRQIYTMQETHFSSRFTGCNPDTGVLFPDLMKLSEAYGLEYVSIDFEYEVNDKISFIMSTDKPMVVEIKSLSTMELIPVIKSRILEDGSMLSSKLEDMYPFLPVEEHQSNMEISKME